MPLRQLSRKQEPNGFLIVKEIFWQAAPGHFPARLGVRTVCAEPFRMGRTIRPLRIRGLRMDQLRCKRYYCKQYDEELALCHSRLGCNFVVEGRLLAAAINCEVDQFGPQDRNRVALV